MAPPNDDAHDGRHDDARCSFTAEDFARDDLGHGTHAIDLDGQVHAFLPSIRDALTARGVLYLDAAGIWRLRWHGFDLQREQAAWMAACDFCSARPVTWNIPCESFRLPTVHGPAGHGPIGTSAGDWAACETCGTFIAAYDRSRLLTHCLSAHAPKGAGLPRELRRALIKTQTEMQRRFWQHYRGGATRIPPHPFGH
jgi:hypothetical protein